MIPYINMSDITTDNHNMGTCSSTCEIKPIRTELNELDWTKSHYEYGDLKEFIPPIKIGKVIKVYDGDTITIAAKLYDLVYRFQIRINNIDTAELKGTTDNVKNMAVIARDKLSELVLDKIVRLENVQLEKYGRLLCDIYTMDNIHINEWMITNHLAVTYHGDTKSPVSVWNDIYDKYWKIK